MEVINSSTLQDLKSLVQSAIASEDQQELFDAVVELSKAETVWFINFVNEVHAVRLQEDSDYNQ